MVTAHIPQEAVQALRWAKEHGRDVFVLGGGSNLVVADRGFDGLVLHVGFRGCHVRSIDGELHLTASAGEPWDTVVARSVEAGFAGLECLSGIPGTVGGTPIQNVGAYGQDVANVIDTIVAIDRQTEQIVQLSGTDCGFRYRWSRFKGEDRHRFIVTSVSFRLHSQEPTLSYPDVIAHLARPLPAAPSVADVRHAVLAIRRSKGMVIDAQDRDSRSVGSFYMNPVVDAQVYRELERTAATFGKPPGFPAADGSVKIPAAWLIERAGFHKGYVRGAAGISTKHPLALINRGGASAREIVELAVMIKRRVADTFGIGLLPEPVFVGFDDDESVAYLQKAL
jgi:UDP-N-acetylmuramate dehydrogenase